MSDETLREALIRELDNRVAAIEWPSGVADHVLDAIEAALAASRPAPAEPPVADPLAILDEVLRILRRYEHGGMVDATEVRRSFAARLAPLPSSLDAAPIDQLDTETKHLREQEARHG